jgi:hypothetical protein
LTLRKLRDELLSSEHGEDFAVHLQSIRRHQFAAGDITMIGNASTIGRKLGSNFRRSRLLFFLPGWHSSSCQSDQLSTKAKRRSVDEESGCGSRIGTCSPRIWQSARNPQRDLAVPDEIWDGMTISIDKIEAPLRKAGIKTKEEAKRGGI